MKPTVLIVDDEKNIRDGLRAALEDRYETFVAKDAAEAARLMQDVPPDAVLTDLRMAGEDGMAVIDRALKLPNQPVCIMMTAYGDVDTAVKAMSLGAYWFFQKPVDLRQVELVLDRGLKARTTEKEVVTLKARRDGHGERTVRPDDPSGEPALERTFHGGALCRDSCQPARVRIIRTREGGLHRRERASCGPLRISRWRHPLPG